MAETLYLRHIFPEKKKNSFMETIFKYLPIKKVFFNYFFISYFSLKGTGKAVKLEKNKHEFLRVEYRLYYLKRAVQLFFVK